MGMFRNLFDSPVHILILLVVILIVFGWKRLPDITRSVGRSMRIFKSEVEEMKGEGKGSRSAASSDTVDGDVVGDRQRAPRTDPSSPTQQPPASGTAQPDPQAPTPRATPTTPESSGQQQPGA